MIIFFFILLSAYFINNSAINTTTQHKEATGKSPAPKNAAIIPAARAIIPAIGEFVASIIAGKVITERVT